MGLTRLKQSCQQGCVPCGDSSTHSASLPFPASGIPPVFFACWLLPLSSKPPASVQFSRSVVSDSLRPHELQHARPPCPSPTPRVHSESRPSSQWCHPAISSWVVPFSSCPQSLPALKSSPMSQLFAWCGQSYWSFSFSIIPSKEIPRLISFRMDWLDLLAA